MQAAQAAGMLALVAGYGYLGDDDRADDWFSAWLARHAARAARLARQAAARAGARAGNAQRLGMSRAGSSRSSPRSRPAVIGYLFGTLRAARQADDLSGKLAAANARLSSESELRARTAALLAQSEAQVRAAVESASRAALDANSETFLKLAREVFGRDQAAATASMQERELRDRARWSSPSMRRCSNMPSRRRRSSANGAKPLA